MMKAPLTHIFSACFSSGKPLTANIGSSNCVMDDKCLVVNNTESPVKMMIYRVTRLSGGVLMCTPGSQMYDLKAGKHKILEFSMFAKQIKRGGTAVDMRIFVDGEMIAILLPKHFGSNTAVVFDKVNDKLLVKAVKRSTDAIGNKTQKKFSNMLVCCGASVNINEIIAEAVPLVEVMTNS